MNDSITAGLDDHSSNVTMPTFFGLALTTQRALLQQRSLATTAASESLLPVPGLMSAFPYEAVIAATAIVFFRATVQWEHQHSNKKEPAVLRWFFCGLLAVLAYTEKSYELLAAVELFSYVVPWLLVRPLRTTQSHQSTPPSREALLRLLSIAVGGLGSMLVAHGMFGESMILWRILQWLTPSTVAQALEYLFPISEMKAAYNIMQQFAMEPDVFRHMMQRLFFVTFHIQVAMGYLGIDFLREEQGRRNQLIRLDVKEDGDPVEHDKNGTTDSTLENQKQNGLSRRSRHFQRGAGPFIFKVALPYMAQIIIYGNINRFSFSCVHDELHRIIRYRQVFEHDNHLTAMATDSPTSPEGTSCKVSLVVNSETGAAIMFRTVCRCIHYSDHFCFLPIKRTPLP